VATYSPVACKGSIAKAGWSKDLLRGGGGKGGELVAKKWHQGGVWQLIWQ